ncbi:glycosyltransferase family 4 protein [Candidatus Saccharibacteria bacterium]|nr:glycosyltransferase family 4 protein [Candidatus Saccharibacteria bacterium]
MSKERRVFLIRNVGPEQYGGGETYQIKLGLMFKKYGFRPIIVTSSKGLSREARDNQIDTVEAPYFQRQNWSGWRNALLPVYFLKQRGLRKWYKQLFQEYEPVAINVQSRDDWIAATGVAKRMEIKVIWTDHMDLRSWVLDNVNIWYKNLIGKWVLKCAHKADKIVMISDYERKSFEKKVLPQKFNNIITIKNGVEDQFAHYDDIKQKKNSICYVGRIVDYKGIAELIEAFSVVGEKCSDSILNIYGDGEGYDQYRKMASGDDKVHFYGRTNEPLKVIAENEVFVLPSYREGLSLSLLDAAMMGKRIIASNVDGNPEVVVDKETGLLVPARNASKLAEAMIWMLENRKEAGKMAKNARKRYEEKFDFDKIFEEKMLPLYKTKE